MANLKRLFGLVEMAVNVPDKDVPGLKRAIKAAVNSKILPPEANDWVAEVPAGGGKAAKAVGAKPASKGKPQKSAGDNKYDLKLATRTSKPAAQEPSSGGLGDDEDDWFLEDEPELGAAGPGEKPAKGKGKKKQDAGKGTEPESDDEFPSFPGSQAYQSQNAPQLSKGIGSDDGEDYLPSFNPKLYGGGHSSWDDVPDWMRDPDYSMPGLPDSGKDSMPIPRAAQAGSSAAPSAAGKPWSDSDLKKFGIEPDDVKDAIPGGAAPDEPKKKGMLSRLFGRKKKA